MTRPIVRPWIQLCCMGLLGLSVLGLSCEKSSEPTILGTKQGAIIGGQPDSRYPAVGALTANGRSFCTGTLIDGKVVLTAAHCVDAAKSYARGNTRLQFLSETPDKTQPNGFRNTYLDFDKSKMLNHPQWNNNVSQGYDIGVMVLVKPATRIQTIPYYNKAMDQSWIGKSPWFLGYGLTQSSPNSVSATRKNGVQIPIVRVQRDRFEHNTRGKSVCHGDSGGPALFKINGKLYTIGVNSYVTAPRVPGTQRSSCSASGVSMRTDTYKAFIEEQLKKYGSGPSICKQDNDCSVCSQCDTKNGSCVAKTIAKTPQACQPCRTDQDCGTGFCTRFEQGYRCIQPCTQASCCPADSVCSPIPGKVGKLGCFPESKANCPDVACQQEKDCGPGEFCNQGLCRPRRPARSPKLCHPCQKHSDCGDPKALCLGTLQSRQCHQACGPGDFCPQGFVCKALYPGTPKQCTPVNNQCQMQCWSDRTCPSGYNCQKSKGQTQGVCARKGGGQFGDVCDPAPCQKDLSCVATISGKRCMTPCGIPKGIAGSLCKAGKQCTDGSACITSRFGFDICVTRCRTDQECQANGGGFCYANACLCRNDNNCSTGNTCNYSNGVYGACAPEKAYVRCAAGQECRQFGRATYCVNRGGGLRSLGERCDSMNRCNKGLICLFADGGPVCFEDCKQSNQCKLGGQCTQLSAEIYACYCTKDSDCSAGRTCLRNSQEGQYGVCKRGGGQQGVCQGDAECPPNQRCTNGRCVAAPESVELPPEQKEETVAETTTSDAGSPDIGTPDTASNTDTNTKPESAQVQDQGKSMEFSLGGGCGCQSSADGSIPASVWWMSLGLLLLFQRRRRSI